MFLSECIGFLSVYEIDSLEAIKFQAIFRKNWDQNIHL